MTAALMAVALGVLGSAWAVAPGPTAVERRAFAYDEFCPSRMLAIRTSRPGCWAKFPLGSDRSLCVPRGVWIRWLETSAPLCGRWPGRWASVAFPNDGNARRIEHRWLATGYPAGSSSFVDSIIRRLERLRERISSLQERVDRWGLIRRLVLDERAAGDVEGFLRLQGFVHLATASGIHLYALAALVSRVGRMGARVFPGVSVKDWVWIARGLSTGFVLLSWLLAGARAGLLRPWVVVGARGAARALGFRWSLLSPLAFALAFDLCCGLWIAAWDDDFDIGRWAPGRWHYALAVAGGVTALDLVRGLGRSRFPTWLREHAAMAVGSWLTTALWDAWTTGWVAPSTPLLSLLTVPTLATIGYPMILCGSLVAVLGEAGWGGWAEPPTFWLISWASDGIEWLSDGFRCGSWLWFVQPAWVAFGVAVASAFVAGRVSIRARLTVMLLACMLRVAMGAAPRAPPEVIQWDVGQGDAALISRSGLIDVGSWGAWRPERWLGELAREGVFALDWALLTHLDEDHSGALGKLLALARVSEVCLALREWEGVRSGGVRRALLQAHVRAVSVERGGCRGLAASTIALRRRGPNSIMTAAWIPLGEGRAYVNLGDSTAQMEKALLPWLREQVEEFHSGRRPEVILKASHHGSRTSSAPELLNFLKPTEAWMSAGAGNRHGHPSVEVLRRFERFGARIRRTDREGSLRAGAVPRPR